MRSISAVVVAALVFGCTAADDGPRDEREYLTRDPAGATATHADARELAVFEAQLERAYAQRDRTVLERLIRPEFLMVHADGSVDSKERWLVAAAAGALSLQRAEREIYDEQLRAYGDAATRTVRVLFKFAPEGRAVWLRGVIFYVRGAEGWAVAYMQSTLLHEERLVAADTLEQYVGDYETTLGGRVQVKRDRSELSLQSARGRYQLFKMPDGDDFKVTRTSYVTFGRDPDTGKVMEATFVRDGKEVWRGRRLFPSP